MAAELAKSKLEPGDQVQKTYVARLDGKYGHLMMSNTKLIFVEETGFLRKAYNLTLELPYEKIGEVNAARNQLALTEAGGRKRSFTVEISASLVETSLRELMNPPTQIKT